MRVQTLWRSVEIDVPYGVQVHVGERWVFEVAAQWEWSRTWWPRPEMPLVRCWAFGLFGVRRLDGPKREAA